MSLSKTSFAKKIWLVNFYVNKLLINSNPLKLKIDYFIKFENITLAKIKVSFD